MMNRINVYSLIFLLMCSLLSCTSDIEFNNQTLDNLLVIDATITNELKQHEIVLTRTFPFGEDPSAETGAVVSVLANGSEIVFEEQEDGIYRSVSPFKAETTIDYQLKIVTKNNESYSSTIQQLTPETQIDNITVERRVNDDNVDGVAFLVDSFDPSNSAKFYKYEFIETFRIIAPKWVNMDAIVVSDIYPDCELGLVPRSEDKRICYRTETSNQFNLTTTSMLIEDRVEGHVAHFLSNQDYKMSHRYSLLLRQLVLSQAGYEYLETLKRFSTEGSAFSQVQTGFLAGNIQNDTNSSEKIIGFFEVASVATQRVFFNYTDFYPTQPLPPYVEDCFQLSPPIQIDDDRQTCGTAIFGVLQNDLLVFEKEYDGVPLFFEPGPYVLTPRACGDCTALGTNEVPDFWIE